jgi:iron-sulfur cluster assembly protein
MIQLNPAARAEILRLQAKRQKSTAIPLLFRLGVVHQGCLGLSYSLDFDTCIQSGDVTLECNDVPVVIHGASLGYLENLVIDYSEDMMGGGFRFSNPQAVQSCSCGHSFAIAP